MSQIRELIAAMREMTFVVNGLNGVLTFTSEQAAANGGE